MKTFSQVNKKAARVSNCCRAPLTVMGETTKFYVCDKCKTNCDETTFYIELTENLSNILLGEKLPLDIVCADSGELILPANRKITKTLIRKVAANYNNIDIDPSPVRNIIREYIARTCAEFNMEYQ